MQCASYQSSFIVVSYNCYQSSKRSQCHPLHRRKKRALLGWPQQLRCSQKKINTEFRKSFFFFFREYNTKQLIVNLTLISSLRVNSNEGNSSSDDVNSVPWILLYIARVITQPFWPFVLHTVYSSVSLNPFKFCPLPCIPTTKAVKALKNCIFTWINMEQCTLNQELNRMKYQVLSSQTEFIN